MKDLRISSTSNLHFGVNESFNEFIKNELAFQKKAGFDAINIGLEKIDYLKDGWQKNVEEAILDAEREGISFEICHLPFIQAGAPLSGEAYDIFCKKMKGSIEAAKMIGAKYAVMHPNAATVQTKCFNRKEQFDSVIAHLAPFVEYAERIGVNTVVENMRVIPTFVASHRYSQTPEEICEVADALGVGICWDFGHANISGICQSEGLAYVGKRLRVIHINDNFGINDDHVPPFIGNINWKDAMHGLALTEFDGLLNFEISTGKLPAEARESHARYLLDVAKVLLSYIE